MKPLKQSTFVMLIAVAALTNSAACNRMAATNGEAANGLAASGTATEVEHDHFPAHWPSTIFVASDRLLAIQKNEEQASSQDGVSREQELIDLVRWLPELAADSDLNEATFNIIDAWSSQYLQKLETKWNAGSKLESLLAVEGFSKVIAELQDIVRKEAERIASLHAE